MPGMTLRATGLRAAALLTAAALAVHELRMAVLGEDAGGAPGSMVHRWLPLLATLAVVLTALALAQFTAAARRARREAPHRDAPGSDRAPDLRCGLALRSAWMAAVVLAAHVAQQLAEGVAAGQPLGGLGWAGLLVAAAGAAVAGGLVAALLGGADRALTALGERGDCAPPRRPTGARWVRHAFHGRLAAPPLARHLAGRAPPAAG